MASSSTDYLCIAWEVSEIGFIYLNTHLFLHYKAGWLKNPRVLSLCYSFLCVLLSCAFISKLNTSDLFSLFPSVDLFMPLIIFISYFWNSSFISLYHSPLKGGCRQRGPYVCVFWELLSAHFLPLSSPCLCALCCSLSSLCNLIPVTSAIVNEDYRILHLCVLIW